MRSLGIEKPAPLPHSHAAVRFHDLIAEDWDSKYASGGFRKRAQFFEQQVMPYVKWRGRWLDAGCGSGYFSRLLASRGLTVTGIDASRPMIEAAAKLAAESGFQDAVQFAAVPSVENLPLTDASFDGCICLSVIEYLEDPKACLQELARVLVPGGTLVLSLPHRFAPIRLTQRLAFSTARKVVPGQWEYSVLSRNALTRGGLARALAQDGFRLHKALGFDPVVPAGLLALIPPSLIFAIAVKQDDMAATGR